MALFEKTTTEKKTLRALTAKESPLAARVLSRPRITEKAYALNALNQFVPVRNARCGPLMNVHSLVANRGGLAADRAGTHCLTSNR